MAKISRQLLLEAVTRVQPGRTKTSFIDQSSCFVFKDGQVVTYNDRVCCRTRSGLGPECEGAVEGAQLEEVLKSLSDDDIDVTFEGGACVIKAPRKRVKVRMQSEVRLPVDDVEAPGEWGPIENPEEFGRAVKQVCGTAGTDQEETMTLSVNVTPDFMEASDRYQAARYGMRTGVSERFLVAAKSLAHVSQLGVTQVGLTPNWVHYRNRALIVSIRRQGDEFYDLSGWFERTGARLVLPRGAGEAAKLGKVFVRDEKVDNKVTVTLSRGHIQICGEGAFGEATVTDDCSYEGPPVTFRIAPDVLETLVKDHQQCEVSDGCIMVRGDTWKYMSRLSAAAPKAERARTAPEPEPESAPVDYSDEEAPF